MDTCVCCEWTRKHTKTKQERWDWNLTISFYTGVVQSHNNLFIRGDVTKHTDTTQVPWRFYFHFSLWNCEPFPSLTCENVEEERENCMFTFKTHRYKRNFKKSFYFFDIFFHRFSARSWWDQHFEITSRHKTPPPQKKKAQGGFLHLLVTKTKCKLFENVNFLFIIWIVINCQISMKRNWSKCTFKL